MGSFSHQSTSTELPGPGVCVCGRFLLQYFRKLIKLVSRLQQFNVFESGSSLTTVMLFFSASKLNFPVIPVGVCAHTPKDTSLQR